MDTDEKVTTKRMIREIIVIGAIVLLGFWALWLATNTAFEATERQYATPCQEDEGWLTVDHRTAGAIEDEKGVSRLCINLEQITITN